MNIFDRLPSGIFNALTGKNNRRTWDLLVRLYENYFGPDAVPDYPDGYLHEKVVREIERFLLDSGWENESDGDAGELATPIAVQANQLLGRLIETGWLCEERVGLRNFISMRPSVARFFEILQQFTNEKPQLLGGNVLMIYNQLKGVKQDPKGQAAGFVSAAQLCVQLISSLSTTTLRVRDLMKELTNEEATPVFVRRFFSEHISELYVRDYRQLRTENHPLRLRFEILELVREVTQDDSIKSTLLRGYADLPGARAGEEEEALDRDVRRFRQLLDVEKFLDRMDNVIDAATQRAIAYLGYRLKATERIEEVLSDTIQAINKAEAIGLPLEGKLISPDPLLSEERLRMPPLPPQKPTRTPLQKREMTVHERAAHVLRKAMLKHREVSPASMKRYVEAHMKPGTSIEATDLPLEKVEDAVAYLGLLRLAGISTRHPKSITRNPLLRNLDFEVTLVEGDRFDGEYFNTPNFRITRRTGNAS
ncbi:MAG: DUF5716 family protein [Sideroxyarcus sp.]|nr:DUF5716 family protein [Sideroxyarcus sp.]